jgi:hypothetical protein
MGCSQVQSMDANIPPHLNRTIYAKKSIRACRSLRFGPWVESIDVGGDVLLAYEGAQIKWQGMLGVLMFVDAPQRLIRFQQVGIRFFDKRQCLVITQHAMRILRVVFPPRLRVAFLHLAAKGPG